MGVSVFLSVCLHFCVFMFVCPSVSFLTISVYLIGWQSLCLSVCLCICLSVCLSLCVFVYVFVLYCVCICVCLCDFMSVCLSVWQSGVTVVSYCSHYLFLLSPSLLLSF